MGDTQAKEHCALIYMNPVNCYFLKDVVPSLKINSLRLLLCELDFRISGF